MRAGAPDAGAPRAAPRASAGIDVHMRIGVNTGEVLVGALRAGGDYTAMGDVVNTASRLQTIAEPGQVVVGPRTHAAHPARGALRAARLAEVQGPRGAGRRLAGGRGHRAARASGTAAPARRSSAATTRSRAAHARSTPRSPAAARTSSCGRARPGVGKSRLAGELGDEAVRAATTRRVLDRPLHPVRRDRRLVADRAMVAAARATSTSTTTPTRRSACTTDAVAACSAADDDAAEIGASSRACST